MKRHEYYISLIIVIVLLAWGIYIMATINSNAIKSTNNTITQLESKIKVLEGKFEVKQDTIIINLNLKK